MSRYYHGSFSPQGDKCVALLHEKCYPRVSFGLIEQATLSTLGKLVSVDSKLPSETIVSLILLAMRSTIFHEARNDAEEPFMGKAPFNEIDVEMWQTMSQRQTLSYQSRREVLSHFLSRYRSASRPQKSLLLDAFVNITGYARKSALRLLNHPPEDTGPIRRPRLPVYGLEVQQVLFRAWEAAAHICAKRLVPYLPTLVADLERCGHVVAPVWKPQ